MLIAGWVLLATAAVIVGVAIFLCLVIRRALTELFFWRGAYRVSTDRALELLEQSTDVHGAVQNGGATGANGARITRTVSSAVTATGPMSPLRRYQATVDGVRREAARLKIDWVSDDDRNYYRAQHDLETSVEAEPLVSVASRLTGH